MHLPSSVFTTQDIRNVAAKARENERRSAESTMTVLEALAILQAAVLKCKKRNVNTPEATAALDVVLAPYVTPK
jgi:ribonucleotide reductase beta subunit family protein with ferritin-like domain